MTVSARAGAVLRPPPDTPLAPARRKALMIGFAQLAAFLADESGAPLLTLEEAAALLDSEPVAIKRVVEAGARINAMDADAVDAQRGNS